MSKFAINFYKKRNGENIVFTHGFVKKTDETPPREIERAKKYKVDYITRMEMESNG